jgi:ligand-binding sensor domain-containing protein/signal transduction histidine kinase
MEMLMLHAFSKVSCRSGSGKLLILLQAILFLVLSPSITALAERLPIKSYTTDDGLIRNLIRHILQDSHGYLWLVTSYGLSRYDGYSFKNYGTEQDVYFAPFYRMIEDRNGGYWIATVGGGLYRFRPEAASKDKASRFELYPLGGNQRVEYVYALWQDKTGKVWVGGRGGLFCLDEANGETAFSQVEIGVEGKERTSLTVWNLLGDREGDLWIGTGAGLFRRLPDGRIVRYRTAPSESGLVGQLLYDRDGRLWIEHNKGLIVLKPEPASAITGDLVFQFRAKNRRAEGESNGGIELPSSPGEAQRLDQSDGMVGDDIIAMCQSFDGKIWFAIPEKGLLLFDGKGFRLYAKEEGLSYHKVRSLAEDSEGNLWIGTNGGGLMKKARGGFASYSEGDGVDETFIVFVAEDHAGDIYLATDLNRISRFDGKRFNPVQGGAVDKLIGSVLKDAARYYYANPILKDHMGEFWLSTEDGLYRFPSVQRIEQLATTPPKAIYRSRNGLPSNSIYRIFEDSRGDIWISFYEQPGELLSKWERATNSFRNFRKEDGLVTSERISSICEDRHGNIWLGFGLRGSRGGVVARYSTGRFRIFSVEDGVPEGVLRNLFVDTQGRLWIASSRGGLGRVDDPTAENPLFIKYTVANGLADNETNCVAEDRWGNIYAGTGRGLDRIEPATGRIRHYTAADGLMSSEVRKIFRDSKMEFWIGTGKGLSHFVPEQERPKPPPPILITGLRIAGNDYPISELGENQISGLELEASQKNLQISFLSPRFGFTRVIRYEYMLEGSGLEWQPINQRTIDFANLQAGDYRFLVRGISDDGQVSLSPASVSFRILRPVWQRWWFLSLVALVLSIPVLLVVRYRRQRIMAEREAVAALRRSSEERWEELERVRRRIATDLHDDIGSSLTRISLLSEVTQRKLDGTEAQVKEPLSRIASLSRELVDSMSEIVWVINPSKDFIGDLSQRMRHFASDLFTAREIDFRFRAPDLDRQINVGANIRREIVLIFKEAVNNIVRHSGCTQAEIEFGFENDRLALTLRDNGKGFDLLKESNGHGLASMRERARRLEGDLQITSEPGRGTTLKLTVPLKPYDRGLDWKSGASRIFMR